ncbi:MAG: SDR family oxidoreductase [Planctomycetes bacterium]|nr:SDR family oxidoreductase [Planctomycetota bacterium]
MNLNLRNQTAVIVGAARGIGHAIAREFAHEGADVALVDRETSVGDAAMDIAREFGAKVSAFVGDVTDFSAMKQAAERFKTDRGRIDHLVFAVAIGSGKFGFPFWNLEPGDWPGVLAVNVQGAVNAVHAFAPYFIDARAGSMLLSASVAGQIGSQTDPPYSASKAAVINFMQCAAKDLAAYNVRVNALCPGMVKTELNRSIWAAWNDMQPENAKQAYDDWAGEKIRKVVPLGQWQTPEEMAAMAVYLASPHAKSITGQCVNVDGGFVMHW